MTSYTAEQLRALKARGAAMAPAPGSNSDAPRYPINNRADLSNAIQAVGRGSGSHDAIRAYIKRRAAALGLTSMIPEGW